MTELNLPEPIAAYFEADRRDSHAVARCFTNEAVVTDEGHTHAGLPALRAFIDCLLDRDGDKRPHQR